MTVFWRDYFFYLGEKKDTKNFVQRSYTGFNMDFDHFKSIFIENEWGATIIYFKHVNTTMSHVDLNSKSGKLLEYIKREVVVVDKDGDGTLSEGEWSEFFNAFCLEAGVPHMDDVRNPEYIAELFSSIPEEVRLKKEVIMCVLMCVLDKFLGIHAIKSMQYLLNGGFKKDVIDDK